MGTTTYAVYDDTAIWGVGETPDAAWKDMEQWVGKGDVEKARETMRCDCMTEELKKCVDEQGGAIEFHVLDGLLMTTSERDRRG